MSSSFISTGDAGIVSFLTRGWVNFLVPASYFRSMAVVALGGLRGCRAVAPVGRLWYQQCRSSYVILLPEIPPDDASNNSLFRLDEYPDFKDNPGVKAYFALGKRTLEFESSVARLETELSDRKLPKRPETVLDPLERLVCPLDYAWSAAKTMFTCRTDLMPSTSYMPLHDRVRRARASKFTSLPLYHALKEMKADEDALKLSDSQRRLTDKYVLEARLNGIELSGKKKDHLIETVSKLNQARTEFRDKAQASLNAFKHYITDTSLVRDFPEDLLRSMAVDSNAHRIGPWMVTLRPLVYNGFMEHCPDRVQRWNAHHAKVTLAAAHIDQDMNHSITLENVRAHRRDLAKLLGYDTFVDMSMETKMAGDVGTVQSMLASLLMTAKKAQEAELESLTKFATDRGFRAKLELWDVPYWRRKQKRNLAPSIGDLDTLKDYFPLEVVFPSVLRLCQDMFGIVFVDATEAVSTWSPDTRFYRVLDEKSGKELGGFYFDPYKRPGEKLYPRVDASWMIAMRQRSDLLRSKPIGTLITNFSDPKATGQPCLLNLSQVELLFERLGEVLQHVLTEVPYSEVAGTNNIEWDAAKAVPEFFKQWLKEPMVLQLISQHVVSGDPLSHQQALEVSRTMNFMAGYDLTAELYLSTLDLEMYSTEEFWIDVVRRLWPKFFPFERENKDAHPCALFSIFSEEWAAAYYSHTWSRMIAADSFNAMKEVGLENKDEVRKVGHRFRDTFLALGGSCHPGEVFRRFRGRDPSPEALLIALDLKRSEDAASAGSDANH